MSLVGVEIVRNTDFFSFQLSPMTVSFHCVAHRFALAMSDVGKKVPYIKKFNDLLQMLYQYDDASAMRTGALRSIQVSTAPTYSYRLIVQLVPSKATVIP